MYNEVRGYTEILQFLSWIEAISGLPKHWSSSLESWPFNSLTPMSDREIISPYRVDTISSRQVMRIKKKINKGITIWSNIKFSDLTS